MNTSHHATETREPTITILRGIHALAVFLSLIAVFRIVADRWGGITTATQRIEGWVMAITALVLLCILYCATYAYRSCATKTIIVLHLIWAGLFTWYSWFSSDAPFRLHELHTLNPIELEVQETRELLASLFCFVLLVMAYAILPMLRLWIARNAQK